MFIAPERTDNLYKKKKKKKNESTWPASHCQKQMCESV